MATNSVAASRTGEELYNQSCASCHGRDGKGAPSASTGLSMKLLDLSNCLPTNREPDEDWHAVIAGGGPARGFHRLMPAFGEVLTPEEREAIVDYTRGFCTDPSWPRGELNFPRALVTEKAFIEDEFVFTTGMATRGARNVDGKLIYEQRFLKRQQFEVIVPFGVQKDAGSSREAGIGDIAVGAKSILLANNHSGTILSVAGEVILPTGNKAKGFGKDTVILEPFLSFGQALPKQGFLHVQTGAEIPTKEKDGVELEGFFRAALGTSITQANYGRNWSPIVEAVLFRELTQDAPTNLDLVPQLQVTLSRRQHIMASLGASFPTLNRAGRDPKIMFYLLWDWFDGGFFEAW
jgi:hypothetical protein